MVTLLGLYVALLPFPVTIDLGDDSLISTGPSDIVLVVLVLFGASRLRIPEKGWSRWHAAVAIIPLISGLGVALSGMTLTVAVVAAKILGLFGLFVLYLIVVNTIQTWEDIRLLASRFVTSVIWVNLVATVVFILRIQVLGLNVEPARLSALNPDPNAYGGMLVVALALAVPTLKSAQPLVKGRMTQIGLLVLPLSIFLTNSRTAWIALGVAIVIIASAMPKAWFHFAMIATVVIVGLALLAPSEIASDQLALAGRGSSSRFEIFDQAWEAFWSSPIFGIGIGQFAIQHGYIVHSTPLWWLGEFGLLGLTAISCFILTFIRWGWRVYRVQLEPNRGLALGVTTAYLTMLVFSLGIEALYQRWWWLLMGLIGSMRLATQSDLRRVALSERTYAAPPG